MTRRGKLFLIAPFAIMGIALFIFLGGWIVMHLWNYLLPALFGWRMITFWQALGLLILCRILFGSHFGSHGWRGGPSSSIRERMRERMGKRWPEMTPEQREKMRQRWASACGFEPPAEEPPKP